EAARPGAVRRRRRHRADEGASVREAERLVEAEDRGVTKRPERPPVDGGEPRLRGVLDEHEAALVAPAAPARSVLREAEVMDQVQGTRLRPDERVEFALVRLERVAAVVEPAGDTGADERLDLGPVVIRRHQHLVAAPEP